MSLRLRQAALQVFNLTQVRLALRDVHPVSDLPDKLFQYVEAKKP